MAPKRPSLALLRVLAAFADDPVSDVYGLDLIKRSGVKGGTLYPLLARLEADGWVAGAWEDIDEHAAGRRRRRYYRLTGIGQRAAADLLSEVQTALRGPARLRPA